MHISVSAQSETERHRPETSPSWGDRVAKTGFVLSIAFLAFVIGSLGAHWNWPVANWLRDATAAGEALSTQTNTNLESHPSYLWFPSPTDKKGLVRRDQERSQPGLTLYTAADAAHAMLLDESGKLVYRWYAPFSKVWPQPTHVNGWTSDHTIYIRRAHVYPNGDLLAMYECVGTTPGGVGMAKLDRESRVLWTYDGNAHHDVSIAADGTIVTLTQALRHEPMANWEHLSLPFIEEFVTFLSPDGDPIKTFSLFEVLGRSSLHLPLITSNTHSLGDILHSNTVHIIDERFAAHYNAINAGDLMVCLRNLNLVMVINPNREEIVWATTGPWRWPHDSDPLENGNILIFDNCFVRGNQNGSRVLEFDPRTGDVIWEYAGGTESPLRSDIRSCQQLLPGGNILIDESCGGRMLEVTRDGHIVWEYVHPVRGGKNDRMIPAVSSARRYGRSELPFLDTEETD